MIWALPLFWLACAAAGYLYTQQREIPWEDVQWLAPAFLLEATLYLALGVERWRARLEKLPPAGVAGLLTLAAAAPYCAASVLSGTFKWWSLVSIVLLAGAVSFWYVLFPRKVAFDLLLMAFMAAVMLTQVFRTLYDLSPNGFTRVPVALGQAMWIRTGLFALLSVRRMQGIGFGFWPTLREWKIGTVHFAAFLPVAVGIAWWLKFTTLHSIRSGWGSTAVLLVLTFFGTLWVLALGEELFFRGLLQQWITSWLSNEWAGLIVTSLLFGSVHFWYQNFPNWKFAILAAVAGVFYGLAFRRARSIRASMVTHALTVTTWRVFFS
jgi:membrane protease YdiL (CAAX protease family)